MADFCKQCTMSMFGGTGRNDLAWGDWEDVDKDAGCLYFICEGCSGNSFAPDGTCIDPNCDEHGVNKIQ